VDLTLNEAILRWTLWRLGMDGFIWLRTGTMAGCCEKGNEPLGYIKGANLAMGLVTFHGHVAGVYTTKIS
jgi:hypothetical protein